MYIINIFSSWSLRSVWTFVCFVYSFDCLKQHEQSVGCYHYRGQGYELSTDSGSFTCHTYYASASSFFKVKSERPLILTSECRAHCDRAITINFNAWGLT
jgi:hypothetical protein